MGKYVKDREFIEGTEMRLREVINEYDINIRQFEQKDNKRAGVRARANLLELYHICRQRRKEICARSKTILPREEHPSWANISEEDYDE